MTSAVFIVKFEHISHLSPVFLLLTLNKQMLTELNVQRHIFKRLWCNFLGITISTKVPSSIFDRILNVPMPIVQSLIAYF